MEKIDKLDKQIMDIISSNARIPFKDVAAACGVSRAAIHQRVQRLIDMNVIVDPAIMSIPKVWDTTPVPTLESDWKKDLCISVL